MVVVFVFLVFRSIGLHPSIFADEWSYSMGSRLTKLRAVGTPLYIYFFVYRLTKHCGADFLECARVLNAVFFVAAAPFIYLVARKVTSKPIAVLVSTLSLLSPMNTFTAYFMPEAMYFLGFWLLTWFALTFRQLRPSYYGAALGTLLSTVMLVKVNAIFLLPGIAGFVVYSNIRDKSSQSFRTLIVTLSYMIVAAAVVRLGIGYLCAGTAGLNVLGTRYGSLAGSSFTPVRLSQMTSQIFGVLRGHAISLALLFGVSLAAIITIIFQSDNSAEGHDPLHAIASYSFALILPLLIVVAYFTASVIGEGPYESLARLHMRYYNFIFPLFLIVVAGQISAKERRRNPYVVGLSVLALAGSVIYSLRSLLRLYSPSLIDSPELHGVTAEKAVFYVVGIVGILCMLVWAVNQRRGAQLFLFVFIPISVLCSAATANSELRRHLAADVYDKAGVFARDELERDERSKLVVVGSELASLYRVLFYIDDPKTALVVIPPGRPLERSAIPGDREWVLLFGDHSVPADVEDEIAEDGYVLFRLPSKSPDDRPGSLQRTVDFSHPFRFGIVKRISGLSVPQPLGRWSDSREVQIEMFSALPPKFDLHLTARAFGPNCQLPFSIRIGHQTKTFRLASSPSDVSFSFTTDGNEKLIMIEVPQPTSPKQLGMSSDNRRLGIALTKISIVADAASGQGN
jgi:phosphoglycerol transferase